MKSVHVFPDSEELAEEIARSWCEQVKMAVNNCGTFSVVLSVGSQDPALYGRLTEHKWRGRIPWESVHIFFADERCVPPGDEESNYKMICGHLLSHIPIPEKNIHRMRGEDDPIEESFRYAEEIQNHLVLKRRRVFDDRSQCQAVPQEVLEHVGDKGRLLFQKFRKKFFYFR